jgi:OOP family OmpA-OmpF porin
MHGCPDRDHDGVADKDDKCPDVAGPASNNGCPVAVKEEAKKRLAFAAKALEFETGKATIKQKSYEALNDIAQLLKEYPDYIITIDGYTDNVGKPENNVTLSKERAEAVEDYFVSKGVSGDRITANGHGAVSPIVSNKTAAGRARNRRVVMDLKLKK